MLVSHCTNSPRQLRRGLHTCTCWIRRGLACHAPACINHFRRVSLLTLTPCCSARYSAARVGPKSPYSLRYKRTARSRSLPSTRRLDGFPCSPCTTATSPRFLTRRISSRTQRSLIPSCTAATVCVRWPCFTSCSTFNQSRCFCVSNNCSHSSVTTQRDRHQQELSTLLIQELLTLPRQSQPL